ncbi:MAG TPA: ankyrin repeat domain-containing protein [Flavobacteriales bacterium]|nr:ankyrin repeat domain-containing protein [Flavobacteriales bacterium]
MKNYQDVLEQRKSSGLSHNYGRAEEWVYLSFVISSNDSHTFNKLFGNPLVHFEVTPEHQELASYMVEFGIQAELSSRSLLIYAIQQRNHYVVQKLLTRPGININRTSLNGMTPLHVAISMGMDDIAKSIIANPNCDLNIPELSGHTPIHYAIILGNGEIFKTLLSTPHIDINRQDIHGRTALSYACEHNKLNLVSLLLEDHRTQIYLRDNNAQQAIDWARKHQHNDIIKLLKSKRNIPVFVEEWLLRYFTRQELIPIIHDNLSRNLGSQ